MKIVSGLQNTRKHKEDFALTPFLFLVHVKLPHIYGIGIQWGWIAVYLGIGFNIPKGYGGFRIIK